MPANRVSLAGRLAEGGGLRHTPAGMPAFRFRLAHVSAQFEAGRERRVECEAEAQVFGDLAVRMAALAEGAEVVCQGFLDRASVRDPRLVLHVTEFELV